MKTGLERLLADPEPILQGQAVGLIANPTTIDAHYRHAVDLMHGHPRINLVKLFGPEHGVRAAVQDMITVGHGTDPATGLPEVSLYGTTFNSLTPTAEQLEGVEVLVFDVQDVGARYYTYAATMALCMRAAAQHGLRVVVLDRPNPIGGTQVEGGGLEEGLENFCALYPVPQRHGMTVGELARLYNQTFGIGCELTVVEMEGWRRSQYFNDTGLPWVLPSPNMPTLDTAIVYPGMCLLEGTNLSEGRGTTRPFELMGAPFINGRHLAEKLATLDLPGVHFRPCTIFPTFHKWGQQHCGGLQLHVTDRQAFESYPTGLAVVWAVKQLYPDDFAWRTEPYEFRDDVPAVDLLTGITAVREAIDAGAPFNEVWRLAQSGTEAFQAGRPAALLY